MEQGVPGPWRPRVLLARQNHLLQFSLLCWCHRLHQVSVSEGGGSRAQQARAGMHPHWCPQVPRWAAGISGLDHLLLCDDVGIEDTRLLHCSSSPKTLACPPPLSPAQFFLKGPLALPPEFIRRRDGQDEFML